jgi:hypothetical protein
LNTFNFTQIHDGAEFNLEFAHKYFGWNTRFLGGKPKTPKSSMPDTENKEYFRQQIFPLIQRAMEGRGMLPASLDASQKIEQLNDLNKAFDTSMSEFNSNLNRSLMPQDDRARSYAAALMHQGKTAEIDSMRRGQRQQYYDDKTFGMGMAADSIANEKRMGIMGAEAYNYAVTQSAANQSQFGTFGTNLAAGAGSMLPNLYFANQMSKKG